MPTTLHPSLTPDEIRQLWAAYKPDDAAAVESPRGRAPVPPRGLRRHLGATPAGAPRRAATDHRPPAPPGGRRGRLQPHARPVRSGDQLGRRPPRLVAAADDPKPASAPGEDDALLARLFRRQRGPRGQRRAHAAARATAAHARAGPFRRDAAGRRPRPGHAPVARRQRQPQDPAERGVRPRGAGVVHARPRRLLGEGHRRGRAGVHRLVRVAERVPLRRAPARRGREAHPRPDRAISAATTWCGSRCASRPRPSGSSASSTAG